MKFGFAATVLAAVLFLAGCAGAPPVLAPHLPVEARGTTVELDATPFFPQTVHQCGPAALATVLASSGVDITPEALVSRVYLPDRHGSLQAELVAATRSYARLPYIIEPDLSALLTELQAAHPVLVLQNLGVSFYPVWHYAVVIGYLPGEDAVILRSGVTRRVVMPAARFLRTWQLAGDWGLIVLRPGELPAHPGPVAYLKAAADLESVGQTQAAARAYAAAVSRWPDNATAWLGLGNTRYRSGNLKEAERSYRRAVQADPGYLAAWNNLAEVLAQRGCFHAAITTLDGALSRPRTGADTTLRRLLEQTRSEILARQPAGKPVDEASCEQVD